MAKEKTYKEGTVITSSIGNKFFFLEEIERTCKAYRRGRFYPVDNNNKKIGDIFEANLVSVVHNEATGREKSSGEIKTLNALLELGLSFESEKSFQDCVSDKGKKLFFDFVIYTEGYTIAIELDGRQHFEPVEIFGGEEGFKRRILLDRIKTEYIKNKEKAALIRIPYTEYHLIDGTFIGHKLEKELKVLRQKEVE